MSALLSPNLILKLLQAAYFPALFSMVGVAMLYLSSFETTISCDRASAECSIRWQYLLRAPSSDQWLMTENAGMVMKSESDSQESGAFRPIIRLQTGREIAVQCSFSSSVKWQERLVREFNRFLDSSETPFFHYTKDNYFVIGIGVHPAVCCCGAVDLSLSSQNQIKLQEPTVKGGLRLPSQC